MNGISAFWPTLRKMSWTNSALEASLKKALKGGTGVGESCVVDGGLEEGGIEGAEELVDCAVEFFRSAIFILEKAI